VRKESDNSVLIVQIDMETVYVFLNEGETRITLGVIDIKGLAVKYEMK